LPALLRRSQLQRPGAGGLQLVSDRLTNCRPAVVVRGIPIAVYGVNRIEYIRAKVQRLQQRGTTDYFHPGVIDELI
jgi:hypothetical protein